MIKEFFTLGALSQFKKVSFEWFVPKQVKTTMLE